MAKKSKRIKADNPLVPISNWEQADGHIRRIGDLQLNIQNEEARAKADIDEIKAGLAVAVKPLQENIDLHIKSLEAFATNKKKEFGRARSKRLNFGVLGWRLSTSISIKKDTTLELIKKFLTPAKKKACINIKETVDKKALAKLTDGLLAKIGARRVEKDVFFVEPEFPEAVDYE